MGMVGHPSLASYKEVILKMIKSINKLSDSFHYFVVMWDNKKFKSRKCSALSKNVKNIIQMLF